MAQDGSVEALLRSAIEHYNSERWVEAERLYLQVLEIQPDQPDALHLYGVLAYTLGQVDMAIELIESAIQTRSGVSLYHYNLGQVLSAKGFFERAASSYRRAAELSPNWAEAYDGLGTALMNLAEADTSAIREAFESGHLVSPNIQRGLRASLFMGLPSSKEVICQQRHQLYEFLNHYRGKGPLLEDPYTEIGVTSYYLPYHGHNDRALQKDLADFFMHVCPQLESESHHFPRSGVSPGLSRYRVGVASSFLNLNHTIGKLFNGIVNKLSSERFEVIIFNSGEVSGCPDADEIIDLPLDLFEARASILDKQLDLLFYPEIGMEPLNYFMAFARLAPVQVVGWGHPVTTGIPNVDYFLSAKLYETDESAEHYTETLVKLNHLPTYYYRPRPPSQCKPDRGFFDLPPTATLYGCLQTLYKFHPDFDDILAGILQADSHGRIVLIANPKGWVPVFLNRFRDRYPELVERLVVLPKMSKELYLKLCQTVDVVLDTNPFCGGNSALEGFAMGVPIVTLPGKFMRGRLAYAFYQAMGFTDLIADSQGSYIELSLRMAHDLEFRQYCRSQIESCSKHLFEIEETILEIEAFFETAIELSRRGKSPLPWEYRE